MTQKDMCGQEIARNYGKLDADKAYAKGEKGLVQINSIQSFTCMSSPYRKKQGMQIRSLEIEFLINMVASLSEPQSTHFQNGHLLNWQRLNSMLTIIIDFKLYFFKFHSGSVYALKGRLIPHKLFCPNLLLGLFIDHLLTLTYLYTMPIFLIQESSGCWSLGEITSHRNTHNKMNHFSGVQ